MRIGLLTGAVLWAWPAASSVRAATPAGEDQHHGYVMGAKVGAAERLGSDAAGADLGAAAQAFVGYEFTEGITPTIGIDAARWNATGGSRWEIAALGGLRWYVLPSRVRPWGEGAAGIGQFVYDDDAARGRVDIGLRLRLSAGVDVAVGKLVSASVQVGVNDLRALGTTAYDDRWLDVGCGVDLTF
jgi:hypothetical protein